MRNITKMIASYEAERGKYVRAVKPSFRTIPDRPDGWNWSEADSLVRRVLERIQAKSMSPIEECVGAAIVVEVVRRGAVPWDRRLAKDSDRAPTWRAAIPSDVHVVFVEIARRFDDLSLDFVVGIEETNRTRIATVECDGAAWHWSERSKVRDRAKDDRVAEIGWTMFRWSGKEILTDPVGRARDVVNFVLGE